MELQGHMADAAGSRRADARAVEQAEALIRIVRELALELRRVGEGGANITLDSALDRDVGLDSLGRVELALRIEQTFGVGLSEAVLAGAETPRDLLRAIASTAGAQPKGVSREVKYQRLEEAGAIPVHATTLVEVLDWHVQTQPNRTHIYLYGEGDDADEISYRALGEGAERVAAGLRQYVLAPGQSVALMLPTCREYYFSFFGILLAGGVPVPIYPPVRPSQLEEHLRRHIGILNNARATVLITVAEARAVSKLLKPAVGTLRLVTTVDELAAGSGEEEGIPPSGGVETALVQYTSGSTGSPKGVVLTHANLLANIRAMGSAARVDSTDVFVSWLPLYHDMGLIGAWLGSLYYAIPLVAMSPLAFLARPQRWLWLIHRHRGTLSAAPNFAYELCLSKIPDGAIEGLDLGSWRRAFNGAEPVSAETLVRFYERYSRYGLRREAIAPVYGLAECSVGVTFPPTERGPVIDRIRRDRLMRDAVAVPAAESDMDVLRVVACGRALPGHEVRIVDMAGRELPDRNEGRLQFRGPSTTSGYLRNPDATRELFDGDWLNSGDLAYSAGGDVYLTSREKDVIIRAGRNIYPYELEEAIGNIAGVRKGCVAVFGSIDQASGTERVIILAETREASIEAKGRLRREILALATDLLGGAPDDILLVPPHTVPKTSSGKIRRAAGRVLYESGRAGNPERAVWFQIARLVGAGVLPRLRRARQRVATTAYAAYTWAVFCLLAIGTWALVMLLPRAAWRWSVIVRAARFLAWLVRVPVLTQGAEFLPRDGHCIIVANHASYLDGLVLVAALPMPLCFVVKAELARSFVSRMFLDRIGAQYVERFDTLQGPADARRVAKAAYAGHPLVFFAEGTFARAPGLLPFYMGAFTIAAQTGLPVIPLTLRGTRSILRSGSWFPRRGIITVSVGAPIAPDGTEWAESIRLRDAARAEILQHLGEPDLAAPQERP